MATTQVTFRMDEDLKKEADAVFNQMGINMTTALNAFVKNTVRTGKIAFEFVSDEYLREQQINQLLSKSLEDAKDPDAVLYSAKDSIRKAREAL